MVIPSIKERIKKLDLPKPIIYDPKENYAMQSLHRQLKVKYPGIYTLRPKKPIWELKRFNTIFNDLCSKINLQSFCAWKELGVGGWHIHIFGPHYNFKNLWKGHITYSKYHTSYRNNKSYYTKTESFNAYEKVGKFGLNEPKFCFRHFGTYYNKTDSGWIKSEKFEPQLSTEWVIPKSILYIDLKIKITFCHAAFLRKLKYVKDSMKKIISLIQNHAFHNQRVITGILYCENFLTLDLYLPRHPGMEYIIYNLKWRMVEYFRTACEFILLECYGAKIRDTKKNTCIHRKPVNGKLFPTIPVNFLNRLVKSKKGFIDILSYGATKQIRYNDLKRMTGAIGKEVRNFFTIILKCNNLMPEDGKNIFYDIRPDLKGFMAYYDLKYCQMICGTFLDSDFKNYIKHYIRYHPRIKIKYYTTGMVFYNHTKYATGLLNKNKFYRLGVKGVNLT